MKQKKRKSRLRIGGERESVYSDDGKEESENAFHGL